MNKIAVIGSILLCLICISGQMPYAKNPEVAVTKEMAPVQEEKAPEPQEAKKEEKRIGAAKKILRGLDQVQNHERKGAAQKIREQAR